MANDWDLLLDFPLFARDRFVQRHRFYTEQVTERLLSQFAEPESETDRFLVRTMNEMSSRTHSTQDENEHIPEIAYEAACDHFAQLTDLRKQVLLGSLAGMYHQWDKDLREHLDRELSHYTDSNWIAKNVWRPSSIEIFDILTQFGWKVKTEPFFPKIHASHLIVNVYKHGKGKSLIDLHRNFPTYLPDPLSIRHHSWGGDEFIDYAWLLLTDKDFNELASAFESFWLTMPERLFYKFADQ